MSGPGSAAGLLLAGNKCTAVEGGGRICRARVVPREPPSSAGLHIHLQNVQVGSPVFVPNTTASEAAGVFAASAWNLQNATSNGLRLLTIIEGASDPNRSVATAQLAAAQSGRLAPACVVVDGAGRLRLEGSRLLDASETILPMQAMAL